MNDSLYQAATAIVPLILAIVCHEIAHGAVARMLGDRTASERGRLTLNPLAHVDLFGTVILPGMLALAHLPVFGWAKPVPVDPRRLRNPRRDMMLVGAAGPLTNLLLGALAAIVLGMLMAAIGPKADPYSLAGFSEANLVWFIAFNLSLALFNLLPIPPFDGSHIVEGVLPLRAAIAYHRLRRWALPAVLILIVILPRLIPGFDIVGRWVGPPFDWLAAHYMELADRVAQLFAS